MGARKTGALIVIEREAGLDEFLEAGVKLDAEVNAELMMSVFQRGSPPP
jgi:diadenylate cyclase